ncbi:hypothetical protein N7512_006340, partial [Penicillium capsulatum]
IRGVGKWVANRPQLGQGRQRYPEGPLDPSGPRGNSWGRFGPDDELGTLNLLTPEAILQAAKEIQTGMRISLEWPLSMPTYPSFNRNPFKQELILRSPNCIYDDVLSFNSQGSTQWDGFRHYANQKMRKFYNGYTTEYIESSHAIGLHTVAEHGGITGRGVLLDYADWAATNFVPVSALQSAPVTLENMERVVHDHKHEFRKGDILFVRSGFTAAYNKLEKLSEHCKITGRYTFYLSSMPLKVMGGVASPPNAFAILLGSARNILVIRIGRKGGKG